MQCNAMQYDINAQNARTLEEKEFSINSHDKIRSVPWKKQGKYYNDTRLRADVGENIKSCQNCCIH